MSSGSQLRKHAIAHKVPLITDIKCAKLFVEVLRTVPLHPRVSAVDCQSSKRVFELPGFVDDVQAAAAGTWLEASTRALAGGIVATFPYFECATAADYHVAVATASKASVCNMAPHVLLTPENHAALLHARLDADVVIDLTTFVPCCAQLFFFSFFFFLFLFFFFSVFFCLG